MVKAIAGSIVVVLVVSVTSFGAIGDVVSSQNPNVALSNNVVVSSGIAGAGNVQTIGVPMVQGGATGEGTFAAQGMGIGLIQGAGIVTAHSPMSATQVITVDGAALTETDPVTNITTITDGPGQAQEVGLGATPIKQYEGISVVASQTLTKEQGGQGLVVGGQGLGVGMGQVGVNTTSGAGQGSAIIGGQAGGMAGSAAASGFVAGTLSAVVVQKQQVN